jgi:hypothetical protein
MGEFLKIPSERNKLFFSSIKKNNSLWFYNDVGLQNKSYYNTVVAAMA